MALETKIDVCVRDACTTLVFLETTGAYNVTTNATGYGTPNPTKASVTAVTLVITDPTDNVYTLDLSAKGFPSDNVDFEYEIPLSDIGNRESIDDGLWQFVYTVTSGSEYIASKTALFHCNANCCVAKLLLNINEDPNDTSTKNKKAIEKYSKAFTFLQSLKHYAYCGNYDKFTNIKTIIDKLCVNSGCKTCN